MRLFAAAFLLGTLALQRQPTLPELRFLLLGAAALLTLQLAAMRRQLLKPALVILAGLLVGFGHAAWRAEARLADELPRDREGRDIELVGIVAGLPQPGEKGTRFLFEPESIFTAGAVVPTLLALTWYPERTRTEALPAPPLVAGERWRFTVRLKRPRGLSNPHTFDYEPWALERGIRATGYVRTRESATRVTERVDGWPYTLHRWRGEIRERMASQLGDARLRGVLVALAIGDQDAIAADDWEVFWRTGVGHLMSISGLHITMLAGFAAAIAFFVWVRMPALALRLPARKAAVLAGTAAALAYSLLTGCAVPAQRTFVMLAAIAACVLANRHGSPSRVLALAALAVVALDPWAVLSAGFWLSFGAVAAIFFVMGLRAGRQGKLAGALAEQLAVTLMMLPMLLALFQEVSLVSPLANAFAIPLVSFVVVPLTIAGAFLHAAPLLAAAHGVMLAIMPALEWLAALPAATLESHEPLAWTVFAAGIGCAWLLAPRGFPLRCMGMLWLAPMLVLAPPGPQPGEAWLDVLDVGNGLAVVVRTAAHAIAYDAGPTWNADMDSGSRIVVPFLRGEGVRKLDGMVISHADDDHYGGAASVALSRDPDWLLSPLPPGDSLHAAFDLTTRCEAGARWHWDGVEFAVLHPHGGTYGETRKRKENDRGCVLRVATPGASVLLAGDVEARSEAEMLARGESLRSDLLLVPHHGSKTSSTAVFIEAVAPRVAIFSVGHRNRFGHPHDAVVERYVERAIETRRTDREGALHVELPAAPGPVRVAGRQAACRYWSERPCAGLTWNNMDARESERPVP